MELRHFYHLHNTLEPFLEDKFFPKGGGKRDHKKNKYLISTKLRLSVAIRYFAGGSPLDIILTHGISLKSVFVSVWGVVDCVNKCDQLSFHFPKLDEQDEISEGYLKRSGAGFSNVIGGIDGILIWIKKPTKTKCAMAKVADGLFKCWRKDKFGLNMQAICDHKLRIRWIDIRFPGNASDYMAWITSSLCKKLDDSYQLPRMIKEGKTILGDNAYIKTEYMSTPYKYDVTPERDGYNFYQSQLRITIECTFGVLVHRWAILRGPLQCPLQKVTPLVNCLCRLHNFCIDMNDKKIEVSEDVDIEHLKSVVGLCNKSRKKREGNKRL